MLRNDKFFYFHKVIFYAKVLNNVNLRFNIFLYKFYLNFNLRVSVKNIIVY